LAAGPKAVWVGGPRYLLRHAREEGDLARPERFEVPGDVVGLACSEGTVWLLYSAEDRLHVAVMRGEAVVEVWSEAGLTRRGAFLRAWGESDATRLLVATGAGLWLLRASAAGETQAAQLDCPVDWIRGAVYLPQREQVVVCGNGSRRLMGFVGVYDARRGERLWHKDMWGTVNGLASGSEPDEILVGVRESDSVERLDPGTPPSEAGAAMMEALPRRHVRDLLRVGDWVYVLSYGNGDSAELSVRAAGTLSLSAERSVDRGGRGALSWDPVWEGVWVVAPARATFFPRTRAGGLDGER
jgi:hypothetical protein